jgi:RNA polymerase sigma-70 factor (ECF subfamily)
MAVLYDRYSGLIYTLALRIVGDRELAREVLQDTFLRCWDQAAQYDSTRGQLAGWLIVIARNRAIDLLRSRQHQARLREAVPLPEADSPSELREADASDMIVLRHSVQSALGQLSVQQREVIELAYYGDLTQTEIAHHLGTPLGTIKTRTRAAMERLRGSLGSHREKGEEGAGAR